MSGSDCDDPCAAENAEKRPGDLGPAVAELAEKLSDALGAILAEYHRSIQQCVRDCLADSDVAREYPHPGSANGSQRSQGHSEVCDGRDVRPPPGQCHQARPISLGRWLVSERSEDDVDGEGDGRAVRPFASSRSTFPRGSSADSVLSGEDSRPSTYSQAVESAKRVAKSAPYIRQKLSWRHGSARPAEPWHRRLRGDVKGALQTPCCCYFLAFTIVLYIVTMGLDVGDLSSGGRAALGHVQHVCNGIFGVELAARVLVDGRRYFLGRDRFVNWLDALLVAVSILEVALQAVNTASGSALDNVMLLKLVRGVRVIRIVRVLRLLRLGFFRDLNVLVHSIFATMRSLMCAVLLLSALMYCFGIVFTQAATDNPSESMTRHFGSLTRSMLSLLESITGGISWELVYEPLGQAGWLYGALFLLYVIFAQLAVLNVMTGIFVQAAIESTKHCEDEMIDDEMAHKKFYARKFKEVFDRLSTDGGSITLDSFERQLGDARLQALLSSLGITVPDAWTVFRFLDTSGDHCVDLDEFVEGCLALHGPATAMHMRSIEDELRWFTRYMDRQLAQLQHSVVSRETMARADDIAI